MVASTEMIHRDTQSRLTRVPHLRALLPLVERIDQLGQDKVN